MELKLFGVRREAFQSGQQSNNPSPPRAFAAKLQPVNKDRLTKARRSWNMSRIHGKDTAPEKVVRSLLHRMGYRFRLHGKKLPGRPDIVLPKHRTVVFVHGCFWHRHRGCKRSTTPMHRRGWWLKKLEGNSARDKANGRALAQIGWRVIVVWQCHLANPAKVAAKLRHSLSR
jgi:DNA mismatch endonuclease (patch repair protein)